MEASMKSPMILAVVLVAPILMANQGCESTQVVEQRATEVNQLKLLESVPLPVLDRSQERENLVKRLERINRSGPTEGCVTLISEGVAVRSFGTKGKVTSLNSYLTASESYQKVDYVSGRVLVESPDLDGAYGENPDGIFFFERATDAYIEWRGDYLWSDNCSVINLEELGVPVE